MKPLRELTPETSYGFAVIDFARDVLGEPLDPWQEWLVIHAGELRPDGRPRFRKVLVIVSRQQGKTHLLKVLANFWLFAEEWPVVLGLSTSIATAKEAWEGAQNLCKASEWTKDEFGKVYSGNNDIRWDTANGCRYRVSAATKKAGGRGTAVDRLILDELREHTDYSCMSAALPTMNARPLAQAWFLSNMHDDTGIVQEELRDAGIKLVEDGVTDANLGYFEWSAPEGSSPIDPEAIAQACPNLGRRVMLEDLIQDGIRAMAAGGQQLAKHLTEILCIRVRSNDPAIEPSSWALSGDKDFNLAPFRSTLTAFVDVAPGLGSHATLALAAVMPDGKIGIQIAATWEGMTAVTDMERDLPDLIAKIRPRKLGWMPIGPAAVAAASLGTRRQGVWPPQGVEIEEVRAEKSSICMGFAALVKGDGIRHREEPILNDHALGAQKLKNGDRWEFSRKGKGNCDAVYAAAGAVHLARTMPIQVAEARILLPTRR